MVGFFFRICFRTFPELLFELYVRTFSELIYDMHNAHYVTIKTYFYTFYTLKKKSNPTKAIKLVQIGTFEKRKSPAPLKFSELCSVGMVTMVCLSESCYVEMVTWPQVGKTFSYVLKVFIKIVTPYDVIKTSYDLKASIITSCGKVSTLSTLA